jgi:hypothetical protein
MPRVRARDHGSGPRLGQDRIGRLAVHLQVDRRCARGIPSRRAFVLATMAIVTIMP